MQNDLNQLFYRAKQGQMMQSAVTPLAQHSDKKSADNISSYNDLHSRRLDATDTKMIDSSIDFNQFRESDNSSSVQLHSLNCYRVASNLDTGSIPQGEIEIGNSNCMTGLGTSLPRIIDDNSSYIMDGSMLECINEMNNQLNHNNSS